MNLGKQIINLLLSQPSVYVPGLGQFNRIFVSSVYDKKNDLHLPPLTYIEFDSKGEKGYNLAKYYQQLLNKTSQEASELVSEQVTAINQEIQEQGKALLDGLGYLLSYHDTLVFKSLDLSSLQLAPIATPDFLKSGKSAEEGEPATKETPVQKKEQEHSPIDAPQEKEPEGSAPVEKQQDEEVEGKELPVSPVTPQEVPGVEVSDKEPKIELDAQDTGSEDLQSPVTPEEAEVKIPVEETPVEEVNSQNVTEAQNMPLEQEDLQEDTKSRNSWYYFAIAGVVLLGLGYGIYHYTQGEGNAGASKEQVKADQGQQEPAGQEALTVLADSASSLTAATDSLDAAEQPLAGGNEERFIQRKPVEGHQYQIVIGSHLTYDLAFEQAQKMHDQGFTHVRIVAPKKDYNRKKVIWDSYVSKAEADSALRYVRRNHINDAWPDEIYK